MPRAIPPSPSAQSLAILSNGSIFAVRPIPLVDESWPGLLLRLAQDNQLKGLRRLAALFNFSVHGILQVDPLSGWNTIIGIEPLHRLPQTNRYRLDRQALSRVCPRCLATDKTPYIRAYWDLPLSLICTTHNTLLLDTCPRCGRSIDYFREYVAQCTCGGTFVDLCMEPALPWVKPMLAMFIDISDQSRTVSFAHASALERQASRVLIRLSTLRGKEKIRGSGKLLRGTLLVRQLHLPDLQPWFVQGIGSFLDQMTTLVDEPPPWNLVRESLGLRNFPLLSTALSQAYWTIPRSEHRHRLAFEGNIDVVFRTRDLCDAFCTSYANVRYWVEIGLVPASEYPAGGVGRISRTTFDQISRLYQESLSQEEASELLGCSKVAVRRLVCLEAIERAHLRPTFVHDRLIKRSLTQFAARILSLAGSPKMRGRDITFESLIPRIKEPDEWARLFKLLIQGKIAASLMTNGNRVADVLFQYEELVKHRVIRPIGVHRS